MKVLRNISLCQVIGTVNVNVTGVMAISYNDGTGEIKVGYDNIAAYEKYNSAAEFSGQLELVDPTVSSVNTLCLTNNATITAVFPAISGTGNVTATLTGVRFGQIGANERYGSEVPFALPINGGAITYS